MLAIDDSREILTAVKSVLQDLIPGCVVSTAVNGADGIALASSEDPDVVLLDIVMPGMDGFEVCRRLKDDEALQAIPVVFLTGLGSDRVALARAMAVGGEAFLSKPLNELELVAEVRAMAKVKAASLQEHTENQRLRTLVSDRTLALADELAGRKVAAEALRERESLFRSTAAVLQYRGNSTPDLLDFAVEQAVEMTSSRLGFLHLYNEDREQIEIRSWSRETLKECAVAVPETARTLRETGMWGRAVSQRRPIVLNDFLAPHLDKKRLPAGHVALHRIATLPVFHDGRIVAVVGVANKLREYDDTDVRQLKFLMEATWAMVQQQATQESLRESEQRYRSVVDQSPNAVLIISDGVLQYVNLTGLHLFGVSGPEEMVGRPVLDLVHPDSLGDAKALLAVQRSPTRELRFTGHGGEHIDVEVIGTTILQAGKTNSLWFVRDMTARKAAADRQAATQAQLVQAQKMESVGRLAGGVAHDFNNLLTVIMSYAKFIEEDLPPDDPRRDDVRQILAAGQSATALTGQLLAFSRKQVVEHKVLQLNEIVSSSEELLRRLIGEDVNLELVLAPDVHRIVADRGQIEQVIMNLVVNSRDAMPGGGTISIETANVRGNVVPDDGSGTSRAGEYVALSVTDTGVGMDAETQRRIFDPFFTTKEYGKGTGLGLSTVHDIVAQRGGLVHVRSQPGAGTTVAIYYPAAIEQAEAPRPRRATPMSTGGTETLLVVDDDAAIRASVCFALRRNGYHVMDAANGTAAIETAEQHRGPIHLLITDVVMPGMNGRKLAEQIRLQRPEVKTLFMSGYTDDMLSEQGMLSQGISLLRKPFTPEPLAVKVREVLDAG